MLVKKIFLASMLCVGLMSCAPTGNSTTSSSTNDSSSNTSTSMQKEKRVVDVYDVPSEMELYKNAKLFIDDVEIPLINVKVNDSHSFGYPQSTRIDSAVARFAIKGRIKLTLKVNYDITQNIKVLPSSFNIIPVCNTKEKTITFEIYSAGKYVIEPNNNPNNAIHLFVDEYQENDYLIPNGYEVIKLDNGIYSKQNCDLINENDEIVLEDNTLLYLGEGAVLRAKVVATNKNNIAICGKGIIDGSVFDRTQTYVPINFTKCDNVLVKDITILDPAAWTVNMYFVDDANIDNINIISSRANGDGITLQSCNNISVNNCFVRGFDDNLVVKNYAYPYGNSDYESHGSTSNISFNDCFLWTDLAQSMEIGVETAGKEIKNVSFENITVFHNFHKPVISIHNGNYALVHDIKYENITVENAQMGLGDASSNNQLIEMTSKYNPTFSDKPVKGGTEVGNIDGVIVNNVLVKSKRAGLNIALNFEGQKDNRLDPKFNGIISRVDNVTITDLQVIDEIIDDNYEYLFKNQYTSNIRIKQSGNKVTGSNIKRSWTSDYLDSLSDEIIILKNAVN